MRRFWKWLFSGIPRQALIVGSMLFIVCMVLAVWVWSVNSDTRALAQQAKNLANQNHSLALTNRKLGIQGAKAKAALCSFQLDLKSRIARSENDDARGHKFLKQHPDGVGGFSRQDIIISIHATELTLRNQKQTYQSVASKLGKCPPESIKQAGD